MAQPSEDLDPAQIDRLAQFVRPLLVELETNKERRLAGEYVLGLMGPQTARRSSRWCVRCVAPKRLRASVE